MPTSISIIYTLSLHDALPILLGNPYSSKDAGMGPLMRDIKNKICQECELVSLLEDDSGLELLVNNKIISLDLPVKEVYKKVVCADHQQQSSAGAGSNLASNAAGGQAANMDIAIIDTVTGNILPLSNAAGSSSSNNNATGGSGLGPTMKIIYRIRGLMGDATEEFIESLHTKESVVQDDEKLYALANIMSADCSVGL